MNNYFVANMNDVTHLTLWHKWLLFRIRLTSDRIGCVKQEPVTCFRYVGSPLALENAQKNLMDMEDDE